MDETRLITLTPDDAERLTELEFATWFSVPPGLSVAEFTHNAQWHLTKAHEWVGERPYGRAEDAPRPLVALYTAWPFALTLPGARVPVSALSWVAVHPDFRRRGLLSSMMRDHLHGLRGGESAIAALHASEPGIYGRFGYGLASVEQQIAVSAGALKPPAALAAEADRVETSMASVESPHTLALLHAAHLACADRVGTITRDDELGRDWFRDFPTARHDKEPRRVMFARRDDEVTGYAVFRRTSKWSDDSNPEGTCDVAELQAQDSATLLALARRLTTLDLVSRTTFWTESADSPLITWAGGHRAVGLRPCDSLWLRVVEVDRALTQRSYAAPVDVVLDVVDDVCPWNAGHWRLRVDAEGAAVCERTEDPADLTVPIASLGATVLGGRSLAAEAAAGLVVEQTPGAAARLSRSMRADVDPVGATGF